MATDHKVYIQMCLWLAGHYVRLVAMSLIARLWLTTTLHINQGPPPVNGRPPQIVVVTVLTQKCYHEVLGLNQLFMHQIIILLL